MTNKDILAESAEAMARYFTYFRDGYFQTTINSKLYKTWDEAQSDTVEWLNKPLFTEQFSKG